MPSALEVIVDPKLVPLHKGGRRRQTRRQTKRSRNRKSRRR